MPERSDRTIAFVSEASGLRRTLADVRVFRLFVLLATVAAVVIWSWRQGAPQHLPGAALGWTVLFYVERGGALLGSAGIVFLIGWRALHGHFPIKFANIEYAEELKASADTVDSHEQRLKVLEQLSGLAEVDLGA